MSIHVTCESCGRGIEVRAELAGRRGKCPGCGASVRVPDVSAADATVIADKAAEETRRAPPAAKPPARPAAAPPAAPRAKPPAASAPPAPSVPPIVPELAAKPVAATHRVGRAKKGGVPVWAWVAAAFIGGSCAAALITYQVLLAAKDAPTTVSEKTPAKKPAGKRLAAVDGQLDREPASTPVSGKFELPKAKIARNVNEVKQAILKFEIPSPEGQGMISGTGFLINEQGWIASNWHVVEQATTAARVRMADGTVCELAGIVAKSPEQDLAIVKLAERPAQLTVLDIGFSGEPELASDVLAFGHPMNEDFVVRKGSIGTIATTAQLLDEAHGHHLLETVHAPRSMIWIRHDTGILPGNSGGPLFLADGRVIGVNTFINAATKSGYASHIRYLRELVEKAKDEVTPLADARARVAPVEDREPVFLSGELTIDTDRMQELFAAVEKTGYQPHTADEYEPFGELARQMTYARYTKLGKEKFEAEAVKARSQAAVELFQKMRAFEFTPKAIKALNARAAEALEKSKAGVVLMGVVEGGNDEVLAIKVETTEKFVCVPINIVGQLPFGSRMLVVGVVSPKPMMIRDKDNKPQRIPLLLSHHLAELK